MLKGAACFVHRHGNRDILTTLHVESSELCLAGRLSFKQDSPKHHLKMTITTLHQSPIVAPSSGGRRPLVDLAVVVVAGESVQS